MAITAGYCPPRGILSGLVCQMEVQRRQQRLATATARAYSTFARRYPVWAHSLFDAHFLRRDAAPLLVRYANGAPQGVVAEDLAAAWRKAHAPHLTAANPRSQRQLIGTASDFLSLLDTELNAATRRP